jgi:hypothetical protein
LEVIGGAGVRDSTVENEPLENSWRRPEK